MIIIHRCRKCSHIEPSHGETDCCYRQCLCSKSQMDLDAPEMLPTFEGFTGKEIDKIHEPGTVWNPETQHQITLCACEACPEMYANA